VLRSLDHPAIPADLDSFEVATEWGGLPGCKPRLRPNRYKLRFKPGLSICCLPTSVGPNLAIALNYLRQLNPKGRFTLKTQSFEDVLRFWFPYPPNPDLVTIACQWEWWFRGGGDAAIIEHFAPLLELATRGKLATWAQQPRSRLALILVLDQFSRTLHRGTAQAFAQDEKAVALTLEGIDKGHYAALETPWEKTFFFLPLGHSEQLNHLELAVKLADNLVPAAPEPYRAWLTFSADQARRHRDVVAQFGRQPHRNEALGRPSTPEELAYLATGQLVHTRPLPPHLAQFLPPS
jgi:uncharacterized protein (DUF924 family)